MKFMRQKFIQDFFEADNIKKLIQKKQIDVDPGVEIFNDMLKNVREDISTMDNEAKKQLDTKLVELGKINKERKDHIAKTTEVNDSEDKRNMKRKQLVEDFKRCKTELLFIQNLGFNKGWLE